jgi:hypothetical protein
VCCISKAEKVKEEGTKKKFLPPRNHINIPERDTKIWGVGGKFYA